MKGKIICLMSLLFLVNNSLYGCDGCGCSLGVSNPGLLSLYRSHYLGFGYSISSFKSLTKDVQNQRDYFYQGELLMRYQLKERWSLGLQLPYRYNLRESILEKSDVSGLGDSKIRMNYLLVRASQGAPTQFSVEQSFGMRLPTGRYDAHLHNYNLPDNFNLGLGSFGALLQNNASMMRSNMGILLNTSYLSNFKNTSGYKFGDQMGFEILAFSQYQTSQWKFTPSFGFSGDQYWENTYANGNKVPETGGHGFYGVLSLNIKRKGLLCNLGMALPIASQYSDKKVAALTKMHANFIYTFND